MTVTVLLRLPLRLPIWLRVIRHLSQVRSIRTHNKYISLIVITQRIEGDPLTIGGERRGRVIASIGELRGGFGLHIHQEDILIPGRACIEEQMPAVR